MRDITKLHPELQTKLALLKSECAKNGLQIGISECVRTVEEQNALYAKGRTTGGSIVTNAKGTSYSSMHQWGVAFDFYRNDAKGAYADSDNFFSKVGAIGQSIGLEWGGAWKSIKDKPHFQLPNWGSTTSKLKAQYGTPQKFMATWKKTETVATPTNTTIKPKNPYIEPTILLTTDKIAKQKKYRNNQYTSKGDAVKWHQFELRQAGFDKPFTYNGKQYDAVEIDGDFGEITAAATMKFQQLYNLKQDAVVGGATRSMLKAK